jgi:hypothetical protein
MTAKFPFSGAASQPAKMDFSTQLSAQGLICELQFFAGGSVNIYCHRENVNESKGSYPYKA